MKAYSAAQLLRDRGGSNISARAYGERTSCFFITGFPGAQSAVRAAVRISLYFIEGIEQRTISELEALIAIGDGRDRTPLALSRVGLNCRPKRIWLESSSLQFIRTLGVASNRFVARVNRAVAKETAIFCARPPSRLTPLQQWQLLPPLENFKSHRRRRAGARHPL